VVDSDELFDAQRLAIVIGRLVRGLEGVQHQVSQALENSSDETGYGLPAQNIIQPTLPFAKLHSDGLALIEHNSKLLRTHRAELKSHKQLLK
jgi:hypothetical protein